MGGKGFTLIELLIVVVIIGILAAIAIPKFANTKEKAILASMKSDLRNIVTAQEGFYFDNADYAGDTTSGPQVNLPGGAGRISFVPGQGNIPTFTYFGPTGYNVTMTNAALVGGMTTCGIFIGPLTNSPNPAVVTQEGAPACW
jgi:prepilin-type N-terminal cleavage/methylation domain-containing protein